MAAVKSKELFVSAENKMGLLDDLSNSVSSAGINIRTISAYAYDNKAFFRLITSDNEKAKEVIEQAGFSVEVKEVVIIELEDKVGALKGAAGAVKEAGIDLKYIYGTVSKSGNASMLVLSSDNNDKLVSILS